MRLIHNLRELAERRRDLRKKSTETEKILWQELRNNKLGARFRRQYSIGGYILDFYCPAYRLIVEIDGPIHLSRKEYDKQRDRYFEELNYQVLRFKNEEIEKNLTHVLDCIRTTLS